MANPNLNPDGEDIYSEYNRKWVNVTSKLIVREFPEYVASAAMAGNGCRCIDSLYS